MTPRTTPAHCAYFPARWLLPPPVVHNPDVAGVDRSQRETPLKDSNKLKQKGDEWYASHKKHVPKVPVEIGFFGSFPRKYQ